MGFGWGPGRSATALWQRGLSVLVIKKYVNRPMSASSLIRVAVHPTYEGVFDTEGDPAKVKYEANGVLLILAALPSSLVGSSRFYALVTLCKVSRKPLVPPSRPTFFLPKHDMMDTLTPRHTKLSTASTQAEGNRGKVEECGCGQEGREEEERSLRSNMSIP